MNHLIYLVNEVLITQVIYYTMISLFYYKIYQKASYISTLFGPPPSSSELLQNGSYTRLYSLQNL